MANSSHIIATEFLRPENTHEPVVYDVPADVESKYAEMLERGYSLCCDVFELGGCKVYIYDAVNDLPVGTANYGAHCIANRLAWSAIREFDLAKYS